MVTGCTSGWITLHNHQFFHKIYPVVDGLPHATPGTSDPSTNPEPLQEQTQEVLMDIERDINVTTPSQPNEIETEVEDTTDVVGSNTGGYTQLVAPPPLRQPSCCRKQVPRNLSPRIRKNRTGSLTHIRMTTLIHPVVMGGRGMNKWWLSYLLFQGGQ